MGFVAGEVGSPAVKHGVNLKQSVMIVRGLAIVSLEFMLSFSY